MIDARGPAAAEHGARRQSAALFAWHRNGAPSLQDDETRQKQVMIVSRGHSADGDDWKRTPKFALRKTTSHSRRTARKMWHDALVGKSLGGYRLLRFIAAGGFGAVFVAESLSASSSAQRRRVAIKVIDPAKQRDLKLGGGNIPREIEFARQLRHPGLISVEQAGSSEITDTNGQLRRFFWYAMEIGECTLQDWLKQTGPLSPYDLLKFSRSIGGAILYLHTRNPLIVHRDVKPPNILFCNNTWKLADLGAARRETPEVSQTIVVGTQIYMPPEAFFSSMPTPAWDVWAFGLTLLEAAGAPHPFFSAGANAAAFQRLIDGQPLKLPRLAEPFDQIVRACLEKDPGRRPEMSAVLKQLDRAENYVPRKNPPIGFTIKDKYYVSIGTAIASIKWNNLGFYALCIVGALSWYFVTKHRSVDAPNMRQPTAQETNLISRHANWEVLTGATDYVTTCSVRTRTANGHVVSMMWTSTGGMMAFGIYGDAWNYVRDTPVPYEVVIDGRGLMFNGLGRGRLISSELSSNDQRVLVDRFVNGSRMTINFRDAGERALGVSLTGSRDAYSELVGCASRARTGRR